MVVSAQRGSFIITITPASVPLFLQEGTAKVSSLYFRFHVKINKVACIWRFKNVLLHFSISLIDINCCQKFIKAILTLIGSDCWIFPHALYCVNIVLRGGITKIHRSRVKILVLYYCINESCFVQLRLAVEIFRSILSH